MTKEQPLGVSHSESLGPMKQLFEMFGGHHAKFWLWALQRFERREPDVWEVPVVDASISELSFPWESGGDTPELWSTVPDRFEEFADNREEWKIYSGFARKCEIPRIMRASPKFVTARALGFEDMSPAEFCDFLVHPTAGYACLRLEILIHMAVRKFRPAFGEFCPSRFGCLLYDGFHTTHIRMVDLESGFWRLGRIVLASQHVDGNIPIMFEPQTEEYR